MKRFATTLATLLLTSQAAFADSEERVEHYEAIAPSSSAHAIELMQAESDKIGAFLNRQQVSDSDMEAIHRISYTLEASAKYLEAKEAKLTREETTSLRVAAHDVHEHSEEHELAETRESHAAFMKAFATVKAKLN